jgi:hypothetical protein
LEINVRIGWHIESERLLTESKWLTGCLECRLYAGSSGLFCAGDFKRNTRRRNLAFLMDLIRNDLVENEFGVDKIFPPSWFWHSI